MDKENQDPLDSDAAPKKKYNFKFKALSSKFMPVKSPSKAVASTSKGLVANGSDGVPNNVGSRGFVGKALADSDSSDDENDESRRARKLAEAERLKYNPNFDPFDPKYYVVQYTRSGKPYRKSTKPYVMWAANTFGYLRSKIPPVKKARKDDNGIDNGEDGSDSDDGELGLRTIAYPAKVDSIKEEIAKELAMGKKFEKNVNEVFRARYYIEIPYCRWCDTRPCACYV